MQCRCRRVYRRSMWLPALLLISRGSLRYVPSCPLPCNLCLTNSYRIQFYRHELCGRRTSFREGTTRMMNVMRQFTPPTSPIPPPAPFSAISLRVSSRSTTDRPRTEGAAAAEPIGIRLSSSIAGTASHDADSERERRDEKHLQPRAGSEYRLARPSLVDTVPAAVAASCPGPTK